MAEWSPQPSGGRIIDFSSYTNGDGIINTSASTNTKGLWELMVTSTAFDFDCFDVTLSPATFSIRDCLVDIGIGGAGVETTIISNLLCSMHTLYQFPFFTFPISIPAGTRISARAQASTGTTGIEIFCHGYAGAFDGMGGYGQVETWGAATGDSGGTSIDSGASIGTKGAYAQLIASTTFDVKWIMVALGNQANATRTSMIGDADIAIGGAGVETIIVPNLRYGVHATDDIVRPGSYGPFPVSIKAGSRISARHVNYNTSDVTDRLIDIVVYGIG